MGIELPVELTEVAAKAGVSWPKADEDAMRSSAAAWREAGDKIKTLGTSSDGAAGRALEGVSGATGDAARGRWAKVVAPDGDLQRAARGCHAAADRLDHAAAQVGAAKVEIVRELVTLAKNNDAATASAQAGNPNALLGLDTLTKGTAANVANLHNTLSSAIRLDSGVDMSHGSPPVNTAPGAHGPGGGGGLLSPVTNVVGGVVETAAPVVGAVTAPVSAVTAPVVGAVNDVAAPVLNAAAPVTAPAAAVVQPAMELVDGPSDGSARGDGQSKGLLPGLVDGNSPADGAGRGEGESKGLLPGLIDGNTGDAGRGEGPPVGRGENKGVLPGLVADTGQAIGQAVGHVTQAVPEAIPSVQGTLGPVAEGTTQASAAVLDQPLIRGGEMPGQPAAAVGQGATPAAPAAQPGPATGSPLGGGGPVGGPVGGAVGAAVGGVASAGPASAGHVGAVVGQQGGAQAAAQQAQAAQAAQAAQQGQQGAKAGDAKAPEARAVDAKAVDAKAAEAKVGEAKAGAQAVASKTGGLGAGQAVGVQAGSQVSGQSQAGNQGPSQGQSGSQTSGQAPAGGKDALAKDAAKDALLKDAEFGDGAIEAAAPGGQKVGETIAAPAAPVAGVDLGAAPRPGADLGAPLASVDLGGHHTSGSLTDRLESNRDQAHALANPDLVGDIARHAYTAVAAGSWFMAIFLSTGQAPRLAPKPARQLPPPPQEPEQQVPTFAPNDHPQADLVDVSSTQAADTTDGLGKDHPVVQELLKDYDTLAGMHERDWESLFQNEDGTPRWPVEREGGYEDSRPEVLKAGAELDRFGTTEGRVLSTAGTPFKERSLPPGAAEEGYRRYRVTKDLPVHRTISAPWFGQPGGGARYRTTYPVADLVALGYLTEITA
ncbi:TNT domain-containing protein [Lentzea rhizosphaerae]|uniref:TNT domain-containing protein n=1 Tax=Lentzea rhizosphaerae TaxID=2041025 RepID=A0ABV8BN76_9PSEU